MSGARLGPGRAECPEADLPTYRVTYRPLPGVRRFVLDVEADDLEVQRDGATLVLVRYDVLVLQPRLVVVLRLAAHEAQVECLCTAASCGRTMLD